MFKSLYVPFAFFFAIYLKKKNLLKMIKQDFTGKMGFSSFQTITCGFLKISLQMHIGCNSWIVRILISFFTHSKNHLFYFSSHVFNIHYSLFFIENYACLINILVVKEPWLVWLISYCSDSCLLEIVNFVGLLLFYIFKSLNDSFITL
jgi:hypothetical protein